MKDILVFSIKVFCVISGLIVIMVFGSMSGRYTTEQRFNKCLEVTSSYQQCSEIVINNKLDK